MGFSLSTYCQSLLEYKIVANNAGVTQLTQAQVKEYFKGKYTLWKTGSSVKVVLHSSESKHSATLSKLLFNTSQQGVKKYWLSLVFQGRANPPVFLNNETEIINYVKRTPGAIGIIHQNTFCPSQFIIQIK